LVRGTRNGCHAIEAPFPSSSQSCQAVVLTSTARD
jgi:hypothetical protein